MSQSKSSRIRYLQFVRGRFAYRRRIPADVAWAFERKGKHHIVPLPTVSEVDLTRLVQQHNEAFERAVRVARAQGSKGAERRVRESDIPVLAQAYERELLVTDEESRNGTVTETDFDEWGAFLEEALVRRKRARARGQYDEVRDGMLDFLRGARLAPSKDESVMRRLLAAVFDADLRALQAELKRHAGEVVPTPEPVPPPGIYVGRGVAGEEGYFDRMYETWKRRCRPGTKSLYEAECWLRRLCAFASTDPRPFATMLAQPPKVALELVGRRLHLRDLPRSKVVAFKSHWLDVAPLHQKTVRKGLSLLAAIVGHALHQHPADEGQLETNVFHHLWLKAEGERGGTVRPRTAFEVEQLNELFSSRLFNREAGPKDAMEVAMFWCLLLGTFTGARLDELGQLRAHDLRFRSGTWWLRIEAKNEDERVKTLASERLVPLHDALVRAGFPRYVEAVRAAGNWRLFACLRMDKKGCVTAALSKRLNRYLAKIGVKYSKRLAYHSLRHGFKHFARMSEISKEVSDVLSGHSLGGDVSSRYGSDTYPLKPLREAVERFSIPGLELNHLYEHVPAAFQVAPAEVQQEDDVPHKARRSRVAAVRRKHV